MTPISVVPLPRAASRKRSTAAKGSAQKRYINVRNNGTPQVAAHIFRVKSARFNISHAASTSAVTLRFAKRKEAGQRHARFPTFLTSRADAQSHSLAFKSPRRLRLQLREREPVPRAPPRPSPRPRPRTNSATLSRSERRGHAFDRWINLSKQQTSCPRFRLHTLEKSVPPRLFSPGLPLTLAEAPRYRAHQLPRHAGSRTSTELVRREPHAVSRCTQGGLRVKAVAQGVELQRNSSRTVEHAELASAYARHSVALTQQTSPATPASGSGHHLRAASAPAGEDSLNLH